MRGALGVATTPCLCSHTVHCAPQCSAARSYSKSFRISRFRNGSNRALSLGAALSSGGESTMAQLQSFNSKSTAHSFGAFQLLRQLGASVLAITTFLVLVGILIGLTGCTKAKGNGDKVASSSSQTNQ